jgi:hypothetical protein
MGKYSAEVEADINKRSNIIGVVLGVLCLPFAFVGGALGGCCPLGSFIGVLPVVLAGLTGGALAAMFLNWGNIRSQDAMGVGVKVGMRTAVIACLIGAVATLLMSLFGAGALGSLTGGAAIEQGRSGAEGAVLFGGTVVMNALVIIASTIPGVLLGILGGVIGAAIKRPPAGPPSPPQQPPPLPRA